MLCFKHSRFTQLVMTGLLGGMLSLSAGARDGLAWVSDPAIWNDVDFTLNGADDCYMRFAYANDKYSGDRAYIHLTTPYIPREYHVGDIRLRDGSSSTTEVNDMGIGLALCGLSDISNMSEVISGTDLNDATLISLTFTAVINDGTTVSGLTSGGPVIGDGTSSYTFTFSLNGPFDEPAMMTATVVPIATGPSAVTVTDVTEGPTVEETQKVISSFMTNRANHVLSHQPDLISFVDGSNLNGGGPLGNLGLNANDGGVNFGFSTSRSRILAAQNQPESQNQGQNLTENTASSNDNIQLALASEGEETDQTGYGYGNAADSRAGTYDVWTELYGSKTNAGASDSSYWVGYVGGHYFINEQTLVGVVGQYDWSEESNSSLSSNADGQGWMIGPYLAGQLPDQKLYYEARALWGQSTNKVSPDGTYKDAFDTTRWLVNAKISGSYALEHLIVKPAISMSYYEETQKSYTDTNANIIPEQTISIGELKFGPTLTENIKLDNGLLFQPSIGVNGVYNFAIQDNLASQGTTLGNNDLRARIDAGFNLVDQDKGRSISASGFYDGIGISDYQSYGGKVRLTISFN